MSSLHKKKTNLSVNIANYIDLRSTYSKRHHQDTRPHKSLPMNKSLSSTQLKQNNNKHYYPLNLSNTPSRRKLTSSRRSSSEQHVHVSRSHQKQQKKQQQSHLYKFLRKQTPTCDSLSKAALIYKHNNKMPIQPPPRGNKLTLKETGNMNISSYKQEFDINKYRNPAKSFGMRDHTDARVLADIENVIEQRIVDFEESLTKICNALGSLLSAQTSARLNEFLQNLCSVRLEPFNKKISELTGKNIELKNVLANQESAMFSLRAELDTANKEITQLKKQKITQEHKNNIKTVGTNTDNLMLQKQVAEAANEVQFYKNHMADMHLQLIESKEKEKIYAKVLRAVHRTGVDINKIYETIKQEEESNSPVSPVFNNRKIKVAVANNNDVDADASIVNDSEQYSFNYADKTVEAEPVFSVRRKLPEHHKPLQEEVRKKLQLDFKVLYQSEGEEENNETV